MTNCDGDNSFYVIIFKSHLFRRNYGSLNKFSWFENVKNAMGGNRLHIIRFISHLFERNAHLCPNWRSLSQITWKSTSRLAEQFSFDHIISISLVLSRKQSCRAVSRQYMDGSCCVLFYASVSWPIWYLRVPNLLLFWQELVIILNSFFRNCRSFNYCLTNCITRWMCYLKSKQHIKACFQ